MAISYQHTENLWAALQHAFEKYSDNPAWISRKHNSNKCVTYQELYAAVLTIADQLRKNNIKEGHTVGIIAPNCPEFIAAALAAWKIGANIAPIHVDNSEYDIKKQTEALAPQILLYHASAANYPKTMAIDMKSRPEAIAREAALPSADHTVQLAVRIYTSGSTGHPKIVRLSHTNLLSNLRAAQAIKHFGTHDRFISLLPLSHMMGLLANFILPLSSGAAIVSPRVIAASEIIATICEERISVVIAVPRLFRNIKLVLEKKFQAGGVSLNLYRKLLRVSPLWLRQILNAPIRKKLGGRINVWFSGGSHLDASISRFYHELGLPLRQGYGLTETSPLTSIQEHFDPAVESVGKPIDQVQVRIQNPDANGNGEIWIKGPNVMLGYENSQQNAEALRDGWFKSGDIGRVDAHGRIFLTGRSNCLIVTQAGKNVYPEELQLLLERNPAIKESGVFEVEMKPACVLAIDGEKLQREAIARATLNTLNRLVSAHSRITRFAVVDELPRTPLGKIALLELPKIFAQYEVK